MDHEVALKTHAVERYLLGEMPPDEKDAFEEHYFSCTDCAEDLWAASLLTQEMKAALREVPPSPKPASAGWLSWLRPQVMVPTFAALLLAVVVGYQNTVVMPDLKAPRSMSAAVILDGVTRGEVPVVRAGDPLRFLTAADGSAAGRLFVEITGTSGAVRQGEVAAPPANRPLDVFFPGTLAPGRYQLVVWDHSGGKELTRSSFEVTK